VARPYSMFGVSVKPRFAFIGGLGSLEPSTISIVHEWRYQSRHSRRVHNLFAQSLLSMRSVFCPNSVSVDVGYDRRLRSSRILSRRSRGVNGFCRSEIVLSSPVTGSVSSV
jgi:hypothetical protein